MDTSFDEKLEQLEERRKHYWEEYKKRRGERRGAVVRGRHGSERGFVSITPRLPSTRAMGEFLKFRACQLEINQILIEREKKKND